MESTHEFVLPAGTPPNPVADKRWLNAYPPSVPASLEYPNRPISYLMESAAERFPERRACTLYGKGTTYAEMVEQSRRFAAALSNMGAGPGRCVGMLLPNIPEYLVALQATWLTGATALQLSPLMVTEELEKWIEKMGCHIIVTLDLLSPQLTKLTGEGGPLDHVIVTTLASRMPAWKGWLYWVERVRRRGAVYLRDSNKVHRFENLLKPVEKELSVNIRPEEDVALFAPTGGTTASPKAVMLTHRNLVANALQLSHWSLAEDGAGNILGVLPFFHAYGLSVCATCSMAMAGTIHLHPRFEPKAVLDILEREKVELVPAVPAMLNALNKRLRSRPRDLSFIRAVLSGASSLAEPIREEFTGYGANNVVEGYGLSEASPVTHCNPLDGTGRSGSIGIPVPDTDAKIMDEATGTKELAVGEVGELVVRGPQVMKGYFDNPEETAVALRDGWLYTGDIAKQDSDGFFKIVDRKKDIIKTSGFLVFPAEVEEVLLRHPSISEAAVVGEKDEDRGEIIAAYVIAANGAVDLSSLEKHCAEHLGKQKQPRKIEVVKELPKNFLGKIQRRKIREERAALQE